MLRHLGAALAGYVAASIAAGFSYAFLLAAAIQITGSIAEPSDASATEQLGSLVTFAILVSLFTAAVALAPAIPAIVALMLFRRTDVVSHVAAGVVIAIVSVLIARRVPFLDRLAIDWLIVSAGAIAGAVFWVVCRKLAPWRAEES